MTDTRQSAYDTDQGGRISDLESQVARSQKEIVKLTQMLLATASAPPQGGTRPTDTTLNVVPAKHLRALFDLTAMSLHLTRVPFVMRLGYFQRRHQRRLSRARVDKNLIDANWYKAAYPEVAESGQDPVLYFVATGIKAGHLPHPDLVSQNAR